MMKTYSHIRRKALKEAASVLEGPAIDTWHKPDQQPICDDTARRVTSQSTTIRPL
jgi:hypothetical protein